MTLSKTSDINPPVSATEAPLRAVPSNYPAEIAALFVGRNKQPLGNLFGLNNFGVNRTTLAPGARSALLHGHSRQDEFVYLLVGSAVLLTDSGEYALNAGDCIGFPAGGAAHQIVNRSAEDVVMLEVGDRSAGDEVHYPRDDLHAGLGDDGNWFFHHKDGKPYL